MAGLIETGPAVAESRCDRILDVILTHTCIGIARRGKSEIMGHVRTILVVASFLVCAFVAEVFGECPLPSKVLNLKPVCFSDADCQKWGQVCCRNQFNAKSCTYRAPWSNAPGYGQHPSNANGNDQKYGGYMSGGPGVYCNGVKCNTYEVCRPDPVTKRLRCQRP